MHISNPTPPTISRKPSLTDRELAERVKGIDGLPGFTYRADRDSFRVRPQDRIGDRPEKTFRGTQKSDALDYYFGRRSGSVPTPKRLTAKSRELTVAAYAAKYVADRDDLKPQTLRAYESRVNRYLANPASDFGALPLVSVTRSDVSAFLKWAALQADERTGRPIGFSTLDGLRHFLSGVLRQATEDRLIAPILMPKTPKTRRGGEPLKPTAEVEIATPAERAAFLKALDGEATAMLWHLLDRTGMRIGEALALRWQYVDLDARRIRIVGTLDDHTRKIGAPKSARGSRPIEIDPKLADLLREHRRRQAEAYGDVPLSFERFVFTTGQGEPYYGTNVRKAFDRLIESSGVGASRRARGIVEKMTPHDLRHGFVTRMLARPGVTTAHVAQYVGDTERMIAKTYAHYVPGASDALTRALAADSA